MHAYLGGLILALCGAADDPVEVYDAQQLLVETVFVRDEDGGREVTPRHLSFRRGDGRHLTDLEFYAYVDRPDLAKAWGRRRRSKAALLGVGIGMVIGGGAVMLGSIGANGRTNDALVGTGGALMIGGIVPLAVGGFLSSHPVDRDTLLALARDKNTRLRRGLGLPVELHFEPVVGAENSGVRLWGRF